MKMRSDLQIENHRCRDQFLPGKEKKVLVHVRCSRLLMRIEMT